MKLPFYTFSPYALIQTYFITFRKKAPFEFNRYSQKHDVFMYIINNDGKANSDKRFETKLISNERNEILDSTDNPQTAIHEFIHDELSINLEEYPEGYLSKLERCWIYGNHESVNLNWNQKRLTEKWDGKDWETIAGNKWSYKKLEIKEYKKQTELTNKKIEQLLAFIIEKDEDFIDYELSDKKTILINAIKKSYLNNVCFAKINKAKNSVDLFSSETTRSSVKNSELKDFIFSNFKTILSDTERINIENLHELIFANYQGTYNSEVIQLIELIQTIDDIVVFDNGEEIKLIQNIIYNLYDLNINSYLDNEKTIKLEDAYQSLTRLYSLQDKMDFRSLDIRNALEKAIDEINSLTEEDSVPLHMFISSYTERGNRITIEDIYNNYGEYPVYSSTITGNIGYFKDFNYEVSENSLLYAIEGNAGSISIPISNSNKIWLLDVAGVINIKEEYLEVFSKESISVYLEYLFRNNRHNNSGQPKFLIKKNLDLSIDLNILKILGKYIDA